MTPDDVERYPYPFHPVVDGVVDDAVTVEVFQLRTGDTNRLIAWNGAGLPLRDGSAVLTTDDQIIGTVAQGDFAVRADDTVTVHSAAGFDDLFRPIDPPEEASE